MLVTVISNACKSNKSNTDSSNLIIFHAGSLTVPFKQIAREFENENPGIRVLRESAGSRESARKISSLHKPCDIIASADYTVIEELLIPDFTDWYINFATNEMCIAYTGSSRLQSNISNDNWLDILLNDTVVFGRSDPDTDPCGYRSLMVMKLAGIYYGKPEMAKHLEEKDVSFIRPKEVDLLALLETNVVDYIFIYKSVAVQHGLEYITLPDEINLRTPEFSDFYKKASVSISGKTSDEQITKVGEPMIYAASIIRDCENYDNALKFMDFLLNKGKGLKIMEENGQATITGTKTEYYKKIPISLKKYVEHEIQN